MQKFDIIVNLPLRIVSIYEGVQWENIILIISHLLSVTPPTNFKSFTSQRHFSTFYIMIGKRTPNQFSCRKCETGTYKNGGDERINGAISSECQ